VQNLIKRLSELLSLIFFAETLQNKLCPNAIVLIFESISELKCYSKIIES